MTVLRAAPQHPPPIVATIPCCVLPVGGEQREPVPESGTGRR